MVVSVCLARGAIRMSAKKVVVKRLSAIHDLGSMDVLCTDKTGTLTEARIRLEQHLDADGRDSERVLQLAYLNSFFETGLKSPLDDAILRHGSHLDADGWTKVDEVPFDFERRRVSVLPRRRPSGGSWWSRARARTCSACRRDYESAGSGALAPLDDAVRARIVGTPRVALPARGSGCSGSPGGTSSATRTHAVVDDEAAADLRRLRGFPRSAEGERRAGARRRSARAGVAVKIVTGDNELVTQHVCAQLGLPVGARPARGRRSGRMDDQALQAARRGDDALLPGDAGAEEPHHPRAQASRPRGRLSRRRHQRRAAAPFRRRGALGRRRRSTSPRGGGDDPARAATCGSSTTVCSRGVAPSATS